MTWDRRLYFPSEGVLRIFSPWKILMTSGGFEPVNLGTQRQHATLRPPKPLPNTVGPQLMLPQMLFHFNTDEV